MRRAAAPLAIFVACLTAGLLPAESRAADMTGLVPLTDMGAGTYLGFSGGLYENGANEPPADHATAGAAQTALVQPLDAAGAPSASGKVVLVSVGMSNTTQEFCSQSSAPPCDAVTFMGQAAPDARVDHDALVIVNGAAGGQAALTWDSPADANYDRVRDTRLTPAGVTEQQVQAVWVKVANPGPTASLPAPNADAYALETSMGNIVRALKVRYPNVRLVFLSTRTYGGYATTTLNPEPYAYESGFAVKWLVQAQVDQMRNGGGVVDPRAGDLNYNAGAPWIAWGPYLWADGLSPRSDGLTYRQSDFGPDGTHPSMSGRLTVGTLLLTFFFCSPYTTPWSTSGAPGADTDAAAGWPWIADGTGPEGAMAGADACDPDDDNNGCTDIREPGLTPARSPLVPWDFADMWTPALPAGGTPSGGRNGAVTLADVSAALVWVGAADGSGMNINGRDYDSDVNANGVEDGAEYDRTPGATSGLSAAPDGAVSLQDVSVTLAQVGDAC